MQIRTSRMCTWHPVGQLRKIAAYTASEVTYNKGLVHGRSYFALAVKTAARTSSVKEKPQVPVAPFTLWQ